MLARFESARAMGPRGGRPARLSLASRRPPHPGEFLESRYLKPLAISQTELASALGISRRRVNELVNGRRAITPDTAVRLAMYFGNDAAFWMHLQVAWDMHAAVREVVVTKARRRRTGA
ncbi:MAG: HigA family addiction module antitoxin [Candidatus Binatia bacterium]